MDDQIDPTLLERFLAGDCGAAERERVLRWVDGIPERQALLNAMRAAWTQIGTPEHQYNTSAAWASVAARLRQSANHDDTTVRSVRAVAQLPHATSPSMWRVAALILAAVGLGGVGLVWYQADQTPGTTRSAAPVAAREVATPRGQRARIRLSDGSSVTLAPGSRLRESPAFGIQSRDVWLEGEAYFEVVHNAARPFRVHTTRAVARDLGTKFLVRAYPQSPDVRVVVVDGSVSLGREKDSLAAASALPAGDDSVVLRAQDLGRLDGRGRFAVESGVALDDYTAWIDGRLVFTDASLRDVIPRLGLWYDVDLRLGDSTIGAERFTATLTHEPLSDVLQLLAATVHARIEHRGDTLILLRRRGPR